MSRGTQGALSEAPEETAWRVPGRVEVLGKHTDYAGGSVLVGAVDRAITARARRVAGPPGTSGVGTRGGSEDHTGMLCGAQDRLLLAGFDPMRIDQTISFPAQWALVVGVSGVLAHKTGAALEDYNRGPSTVQAVLARWNETTGRTDASLAGAVRHLVGEATGEQAAGDPALKKLLGLCEPGYERQRIEQFLTESLVLVPTGAQMVAAADPDVGEVLQRSQELADRGLCNQVPQTRLMVSLARQAGAIGASSFGAGWGGSVYALVRADDAETFAAQWLGAYRDREPGAEQAAVIVTRPGPGACRLL